MFGSRCLGFGVWERSEIWEWRDGIFYKGKVVEGDEVRKRVVGLGYNSG